MKARSVISLGRYSAFLHAVDIDLKVGRFLVSLIPEKPMQAIRTINDM